MAKSDAFGDVEGTFTLDDSGDYWEYQWDLSNRLTGINHGTSVQYRYNAKGLRVEKSKGTETRFYIYDLQGQVVHEEIVDTDVYQYREYIYAFGQHLARVDGTVDA